MTISSNTSKSNQIFRPRRRMMALSSFPYFLYMIDFILSRQRQQLATQDNTQKKVADHQGHQCSSNDDEECKSSKKWRKSKNTHYNKKARKKCAQDEDCHDSFFQLCLAGRCQTRNCSLDSDCPARSKCHSASAPPTLCRSNAYKEKETTTDALLSLREILLKSFFYFSKLSFLFSNK